MYKVDFEAERKSREELNDERLQLQEKLLGLEEELQALRLATNQLPEHYGYAAARRSAGPVVAQETPPMGHGGHGDVYQPQPQRRIAQENTALPGTAASAAAAPAATANPADPRSANRPPAEVSLNISLLSFKIPTIDIFLFRG